MKNSIKRWYVAVLIVQVTVDKRKKKRPLYDRQIKLVKATNHNDAYKKAIAFGKTETHSYLNSKGKNVCWEFLGLADLDLILENEIGDGSEIYSTVHRGMAKNEVVPKKSLSVFWSEANKDKKAGELLAPAHRPYAPA